MPEISNKMLEDLLKQALFDSIIECPTCGRSMEPDYDKCPDCGKTNPLQLHGLI